MNKNVYVKDIRSGTKVDSLFMVREKNLAFSNKGAPYHSLRLGDRTGTVEAKIWENALELDRIFKRGDVVFIQARATSYKNAIQLSVNNLQVIPTANIDLTDYLPVAAGDRDEMFAELLAFIEGIGDPHLKELLKAIFTDEEISRRFKLAPAAKGFHHVYLGGLLEHTLSVVRLLSLAVDHYAGLNRDLIIAGGILHDLGKIYEFTYNRIIDYTDEGRLIGHIVKGVEMTDAKIALIPEFPESLAVELKHIILSHHGSLEYGSPKLPNTTEALAVHMIDDLDAKINAFQEHIKASPDDETGWTAYHRLFDRYIYKGNRVKAGYPGPESGPAGA